MFNTITSASELVVIHSLNIFVRTVANFFHWSMFFLWALVKWSQTFLWLAALNTFSIWVT